MWAIGSAGRQHRRVLARAVHSNGSRGLALPDPQLTLDLTIRGHEHGVPNLGALNESVSHDVGEDDGPVLCHGRMMARWARESGGATG